MCGIAGIFNYKNAEPVNPRLLKRMCDSIAHRGPDSEGQFIHQNIGLGHRRLAIIDLTPSCHQPMLDREKKFALSFNGEIYNHQALRKELESLGHGFTSSSDTEVVLYAYKQWGIDFLPKLNGIYAIAIANLEESELLLARDPVGIKPLFYFDNGERISFASEIKAILTDDRVSREIHDRALDEYFHYNYSSCPNTGLKNVRQLEPGKFILIKDGKKSTQQFYAFAKHATNSKMTDGDYQAEFEQLFSKRVADQSMADVPVGAFLSGGIDSTTVAAHLKKNKIPVNLIHVSFKNSSYDESGAAKEIAKSLQLPLKVVEGESDVRDLPEKISKHLEEPTADSSSLAVYLLCQETVKQYKVALSGDGADELFAGYETYNATILAQKLKGFLPRASLKLLNSLARHLPTTDSQYSAFQLINRFSLYAGKPFPQDHAGWRTIFHESTKSQLYSKYFRNQTSKFHPWENYAGVLSEIDKDLSKIEKALYMDFRFYLPNDMLVKVDRMSMAHGLEVRVPFLDLEVIDFAHKLPTHLKICGKKKKVLLRNGLRGLIPDSVLNLPKSGFSFPIESFLRTEWKELFFDLMNTHRAEISQYLDLEHLKDFFTKHEKGEADHRHELFAVLMFMLWIQNLKQEWKN